MVSVDSLPRSRYARASLHSVRFKFTTRPNPPPRPTPPHSTPLHRMQFPLCYNYLLFLRYNASESSAFTALMSNMDTIPLLGTSLSVYLPLFTVALCAATFFNVYARLLAKLGIEHDDAIIYGGDAEEVRS